MKNENLINGTIYVIKSLSTDKIYIGSTTQRLTKRFNDHKDNYRRYLKGKYHYVTVYEILKYDDCFVEIIKEIVCTRKQLLILEGLEIEKNEKAVNKQIAGIFKRNNLYEYGKQYREKHPRIHIHDPKKYKIYYENNRDGLFKPIICECGGSYIQKHKFRHEKTIKHNNYLKNKI